MRKSFLKIFLLFFILIFSFSVMMPRKTDAFGLPFGGMMVFSLFCTCSGNFIIFVVGPKNPGFYSYRFTPQYANFKLPSGTGSWILGTSIGGDTCLMYAGITCATFAQPRGIISNLVGTS